MITSKTWNARNVHEQTMDPVHYTKMFLADRVVSDKASAGFYYEYLAARGMTSIASFQKFSAGTNNTFQDSCMPNRIAIQRWIDTHCQDLTREEKQEVTRIFIRIIVSSFVDANAASNDENTWNEKEIPSLLKLFF